MKLATISSKNQITLPVDILKELGLKAGYKVMIQKETGQKKITLSPAPQNMTDYFAGSAQKTFEELEGGENFLKQLRAEWE